MSTSMFERITARFGQTPEREQYPNTDDYTPPEEVADPHTFEDETHDSLVDKALKYRWWLLSVSLLATAVLILLAVYFGRYFITVALNPWVQRGVAVAVIFAGGVYLGTSSERGRLRREDELTIFDPEREQSTHYLGEYRDIEGAEYGIFIPWKGRRGLLGGDPEPYRAGELSHALEKKYGHDGSKPARILLYPDFTTVQMAARGRKITALGGSDPQPNPFGADSNLKLDLPETASESTVMNLTNTLERREMEIRQLRKKINTLERQRDEAQTLAKSRFAEFREILEHDADLFTKFLPARRQNGDGRDDRDRLDTSDILELGRGDDR